MGTIIFNMEQVLAMAEAIGQFKQFRAQNDDAWNPELYPNKVLVDSEGRTQSEVEKAGGLFWPDSFKLDQSLVKPQLLLVGDEGVYLTTNAYDPEKVLKSPSPIYAEGCDPKIDDDWFDRKGTVFGFDDGVVSIPLEWVEIAKSDGRRTFKIKLTSRSVGLVK